MKRRFNGEGTIYHRSDGRWAGTITLADGTRRTVYGRNSDAVQVKMQELRRARENGMIVASARAKTGDYLVRWLDETARQSIRPKTYENYALNVRRLLPLIGSVRLESLTPAHIQWAYGRLSAKGLAPRSVRQAHVVLHRALRQASQWGMLPRNPADAVSLPRPERTEIEVLSEAEVRQLIEGTHDDGMHALWVLLATTGLRLGEALGLRWDDLDLMTGRLTIRRALQRQRGAGLVFVEPKTGKSRRTVYLALGMVRTLAEPRQRQTEERLLKGPAWQDGDLIFCTEIGRPLEGGQVSWRFHKALDRVGLHHMRLHDLRHTAATHLLTRGVHPKIVQELLGHSTITLTLDTYSHVSPALHAEVAKHMEVLFLPGPAA